MPFAWPESTAGGGTGGADVAPHLYEDTFLVPTLHMNALSSQFAFSWQRLETNVPLQFDDSHNSLSARAALSLSVIMFLAARPKQLALVAPTPGAAETTKSVLLFFEVAHARRLYVR